MNAQFLGPDQLVHRVGWCLVHFVWQGLLVALALAVMLGLLRKRSANVRYLACFGALLLMAAFPIVTYWLQDGPVAQATPAIHPSSAPVASSGAVSAPDTSRAIEMIAGGSLKARSGDLIEAILPWLCMAWIVGVLALALHNVAAWFYIRRLVRRETTAMGAPWLEWVDTLRLSLGIRRPVRLLQSARAVAPMAAGILKPVILLPAAVMAGLTPAQVEAILAHELAHIRRHDFLANLVQVAIETILFYHPAVWWVSRRVRDERENCCDDLAVRACGSTLQYARALTTLAELVTAPAVLAVTATGGLLRRIQRIVGLPQERPAGFAPFLAGMFVMFVLLGSLLGAQFGCERVDLTPLVAQLNIDTATKDDLVRAFGIPKDYAWDGKHFDENNLPANYCIVFPNGVIAWMCNDNVQELRFQRNNYVFRGNIHVGSTLDDVLNALGQPTQIVQGQPNGFYTGVLYKDIDGRKGYCYYAREDCAVRIWFDHYKVGELYVTRSDFSGGGRPPDPADTENVDLTPAVATLNLDTATRDDLARAFGKPQDYVWGNKHFDENNLPANSYIIQFPHGVDVWMDNKGVVEARFNRNNYAFRGKIHVGSTLDEVLNVLGQPTQTLEGQPNGFYDQVLYKDIDGRKGYCYYGREDCAVRLWFLDYKVTAVYVTRSDYTDSGRPPKTPGAPEVDLAPSVEKINIDTATKDDLVRAFGNPLKYVWGGRRVDANNLPANYIILFPNCLDVWIRNNAVNELRFYEPNYAFRGKIRVGSTVDEVINALGQPAQTVEGQPNKFQTGVLYKDIDGHKGYCYYAREDCAVRTFFKDYKVSALYVTRSDFSGGDKPK